jgi:hypothetical protein
MYMKWRAEPRLQGRWLDFEKMHMRSGDIGDVSTEMGCAREKTAMKHEDERRKEGMQKH